MTKISIGVAKLLTFTSLLLQNVRCDNDVGENSLPVSVVGMKFLLETERQLLSVMEDYADQLENKLRIIRSAFTEMHTEHLKSQINPTEYLSNSISSHGNAFISRLSEEWANWEQFLRSLVGADEINKIKELTSSSDMPTSVDLLEAVQAIYRLNSIYDLHPADLAAGLINGKQYDARFSALDCFSIGKLMMKNKLYYQPADWLHTSLMLYEDSDINDVLDFDSIKIYELYAEVLFKHGFFTEALETVNIALNLSPHNYKLLRLQSEIEFEITMPSETLAKTEKEFEENEDTFMSDTDSMKPDCYPYFYQSNLHCLYNKTTTAFLQLAPLKMEILHLDPYVVLYHDVISDNEIANLKNEAENNLYRAGTYNTTSNMTFMNKDRTVKSYWLEGITNTSERIYQRITDMSGFDLWDSDAMEIMNYGMGGHYRSHYDFFNFTEVSEKGDRIATVLFYLSDVDQGGATVFPDLEIGVLPKKGAALMWYNLNNRGEIDTRALHGACPVIVGSKWAMTLWISQYSQMFRRPCFA